MIPYDYVPERHCDTGIGWSDPRTREGEPAWPERFSAEAMARFRPRKFMWASQYQQSPEPRGGSIFQRDWWQLWEAPDGKFPVFEYLLASLDSAFTEKEENDPSALTIWGIFLDKENQRRVMLVHAWRKHLQFSGPRIELQPGESPQAYRRRCQPTWGLMEWVFDTCNRFKVDLLLIEAKASGISAAQELRNRYGLQNWGVHLCKVKGDKVARALACQPTFSQMMVFAPERDWSELVIDEMAVFPKGRFKDLTDSTTQAVKHLRDVGLLQSDEEVKAEETARVTHRPRQQPLYPV
jgi:predicted phage terminase large subunit-like protein